LKSDELLVILFSPQISFHKFHALIICILKSNDLVVVPIHIYFTGKMLKILHVHGFSRQSTLKIHKLLLMTHNLC